MLLTGQAFNPATDLLFLDEIGECAQAVTSLKCFAEKFAHGFVVASGFNKVEQYKLQSAMG